MTKAIEIQTILDGLVKQIQKRPIGAITLGLNDYNNYQSLNSSIRNCP